jgi:ABC-type multidrug transport system ATPase subunit
LAGDTSFRSEVTGEIMFNRRAPRQDLPLWQRAALVESHDELYRDLTVKEIVTFAMKLRCRSQADVLALDENVTGTIETLHLDR